MNKSSIIAGALAVVVLAGFGLTANQTVFAYRGDATVKGPNHTVEREAAMDKAINAKDFAAWKTLMTQDGRTPGVVRIVDTQAEFEKFAQAHILSDAGKTAEANALRAELGLGNGQGRGGMHNGGQGNGGGFVDANKNGVCDRME